MHPINQVNIGYYSFFDNDTVDFFDSLGKDIEDYSHEFVDFAKRFSSKF